MSEEEKEALEIFKNNANYCVTSKEITKIILNLIEKQQEEIENLEDKINDLYYGISDLLEQNEKLNLIIDEEFQ